MRGRLPPPVRLRGAPARRGGTAAPGASHGRKRAARTGRTAVVGTVTKPSKYPRAGQRVIPTRVHVNGLPAEASPVRPEDGFAMVQVTDRWGQARLSGSRLADGRPCGQREAACGFATDECARGGFRGRFIHFIQ